MEPLHNYQQIAINTFLTATSKLCENNYKTFNSTDINQFILKYSNVGGKIIIILEIIKRKKTGNNITIIENNNIIKKYVSIPIILVPFNRINNWIEENKKTTKLNLYIVKNILNLSKLLYSIYSNTQIEYDAILLNQNKYTTFIEFFNDVEFSGCFIDDAQSSNFIYWNSTSCDKLKKNYRPIAYNKNIDNSIKTFYNKNIINPPDSNITLYFLKSKFYTYISTYSIPELTKNKTLFCTNVADFNKLQCISQNSYSPEELIEKKYECANIVVYDYLKTTITNNQILNCLEQEKYDEIVKIMNIKKITSPDDIINKLLETDNNYITFLEKIYNLTELEFILNKLNQIKNKNNSIKEKIKNSLEEKECVVCYNNYSNIKNFILFQCCYKLTCDCCFIQLNKYQKNCPNCRQLSNLSNNVYFYTKLKNDKKCSCLGACNCILFKTKTKLEKIKDIVSKNKNKKIIILGENNYELIGLELQKIGIDLIEMSGDFITINKILKIHKTSDIYGALYINFKINDPELNLEHIDHVILHGPITQGFKNKIFNMCRRQFGKINQSVLTLHELYVE